MKEIHESCQSGATHTHTYTRTHTHTDGDRTRCWCWCSGCSIICTRSYRRALLMIRINDAEYISLSRSHCRSAASSFEMRPSISLCRSRRCRRSRSRSSSSSRISPVASQRSLADAFAYKLLLMSRYQSDCINVAASRHSCNARPSLPCHTMPWVPWGLRERSAFIQSYSCIAGLMLIFPGNTARAIDVWITLTWWLCIIYAARCRSSQHSSALG